MKEKYIHDLLNLYRQGCFPMAETHQDPEIYCVEPKERGVIFFENFNIPKSLKKTIRKQPYSVHINQDFKQTLLSCATPNKARTESWINQTLIDFYLALYQKNLAHSVECWQGDEFVGGLFGIHLNRVFFGESMISFKENASKIALVYLVYSLLKSGVLFLDTQFITNHLKQFGACVISQTHYLEKLKPALQQTILPLYQKKFPSPETVLCFLSQHPIKKTRDQ